MSFKNRKLAILDKRTGKMRTLTPGKIKLRMDNLENAILSELYSLCQTNGGEIPLECWKRYSTVLSGLCDDSIREIPSGSWETLYVQPGEEGMIIQINEL